MSIGIGKLNPGTTQCLLEVLLIWDTVMLIAGGERGLGRVKSSKI